MRIYLGLVSKKKKIRLPALGLPFFLLISTIAVAQQQKKRKKKKEGCFGASRLASSLPVGGEQPPTTHLVVGRSRRAAFPSLSPSKSEEMKRKAARLPVSSVGCRQRLAVVARLPTAQMWHFSIPDHPTTGLRHDAVGFTCVGNPGQ